MQHDVRVAGKFPVGDRVLLDPGIRAGQEFGSALTNSDLMQIMELLIQQLNTNLVHKAITLSVTDDAKQWILEKTSSERNYGARPLRRALQRFVEDPLSEALIAGGIAQRPAFLEVYLENNQLFYRPISADGSADGDDKVAGLALTTV